MVYDDMIEAFKLVPPSNNKNMFMGMVMGMKEMGWELVKFDNQTLYYKCKKTDTLDSELERAGYALREQFNITLKVKKV